MPLQHILTAALPNSSKIERQQLLGTTAREPINILKTANLPTTNCNMSMTTIVNPTSTVDGENKLGTTTVVLQSNINTHDVSSLYINNTAKALMRQIAPPQTLKIPFSPSLPQLCTTPIDTEFSMRQRQFLLQKRDICSQFFDLIKTKTLKEEALISEPANTGPTQILDFMFLGSLEDALNVQILKKNNIKKIINISESDACPQGLKNDAEHFFRIPVVDSNKTKLIPYFEDTYKFIESARQSGENILLHCMAGISRSPTLAIAYLMRSKKIGCEEARKYVKNLRPLISPNMNFMGQLIIYENALRSNHILPPLMRHSYTCDSIESEIIHKTEKKILPTSDYLFESSFTKNDWSIPRLSNTTAFAASNQDSQENVPRRIRPTCFGEINARSSMPNKLVNTKCNSTSFNLLTPSNPISCSTSFVNENGKRTIDIPLALPERSRQLFGAMPSFSSSLSSSTSSLSETLFGKVDVLSLPLKKVDEEVPSPSTEFSKLDISLINPCFDIVKPHQKLGKKMNTSTTTSSGIFLKDLENGQQSFPVEDAVELPPCTSTYSIVDIKPTIKNSMFENPMFSILSDENFSTQNEGLFAKTKRNLFEPFSFEKKRFESLPKFSHCTKRAQNIENTQHSATTSGFFNCKSLMCTVIRKSQQNIDSIKSSSINPILTNKQLFNSSINNFGIKNFLQKKTRPSCCKTQLQHNNLKKKNFNCCCHNWLKKNSRSPKELFFDKLNRQMTGSSAIKSINFFSKKTKFGILPTLHDVDVNKKCNFQSNFLISKSCKSVTKNSKSTESYLSLNNVKLPTTTSASQFTTKISNTTHFKKNLSSKNSIFNSIYTTGNQITNNSKMCSKKDKDVRLKAGYNEKESSMNNTTSNSLYSNLLAEKIHETTSYLTPTIQNINDSVPSHRFNTKSPLLQLITTSSNLTMTQNSLSNDISVQNTNDCDSSSGDFAMEAACRDPDCASISSASSLEITVQ